MSKKILVVGSINMDLVVNADEIPKIGETLIGKELLQIPGGKGANQGVAIAKLENDITFLGKVGNDSFGDLSLESMKKAGVKTNYIERVDTSTGIAVINVDSNGNNNIVVIPGANNLVDKDYLIKHESVFKDSDVVLFQFEIPLETVKEGLKIAKKYNKLTIVNPAPAIKLDDETIKNIDILVPNEHELTRLSGIEVKDRKSAIKAGEVLLEKGVKDIIVTLGSSGAMYISKDSIDFYDAYKVKAVDTTAAGDSFIGGFISSYIQNSDVAQAVDRGQRTAALAIQKVGAQSSLPTKEEVDRFI